MKQNHFKLTSNTFRTFLYDFEQVLRFITRNYLQTRISKKKVYRFPPLYSCRIVGKSFPIKLAKLINLVHIRNAPIPFSKKEFMHSGRSIVKLS